MQAQTLKSCSNITQTMGLACNQLKLVGLIYANKYKFIKSSPPALTHGSVNFHIGQGNILQPQELPLYLVLDSFEDGYKNE